MPDVLRFTDQFHRPGSRSPVTWTGRHYFLKDVAELEPRVLKDLLRLHLRARRSGTHGWRLTAIVREEIKPWAPRWWLTAVDPVGDNWPCDVALSTLAHWREYPEILERLGPRWHFPSHGAPFALTEAEEADQRRARRRKRGRARFVELAARRGFKQRPILRARRALRRLALYQVCGWSLSRLAGSTLDNDKQVVKRSLRRTAQLIGLRLRSPGKPGPRAHKSEPI